MCSHQKQSQNQAPKFKYSNQLEQICIVCAIGISACEFPFLVLSYSIDKVLNSRKQPLEGFRGILVKELEK